MIEDIVWTNVKALDVSFKWIYGNILDYYDNKTTGGNIGICLFNYGNEPQVIEKGERIAQFAFMPYLVADNCNTKVKRQGGFGSTDKLAE